MTDSITLPSGAVLSGADVDALKTALGLEQAAPAEAEQAPAESAAVPVNAHPAYSITSELLSLLNLGSIESHFRTVYAWLEDHATDVEHAL